MLGYDDGGAARAKEAGEVGKRMRVMNVNDVGPFPRGRNVTGGDFLRTQGCE
jgi:hypothetical protein